jgi:hypothetical protein
MMSFVRTRSTYFFCVAPFGAIGRPERGVRIVSPKTPWIDCPVSPLSSCTARTTSSEDSGLPASASS